MASGGICIPVCASTVFELKEKIEAAAALADLVEVRFDCLEKTELIEALGSLPHIAKPYIFTYRPKEQGGLRELNLHERHDFWERVADGPPAHDVIADIEQHADFPVKFPPEKTIASMHEFAGDRTADVGDSIFDTNASIVKLAVAVKDAADAIAVWKLLGKAESAGKCVIPVAMGEAGKWTRLLGLAHGAYLTYASLFPHEATAPGQISAADMIEVFRVRELTRETAVYGIIAGDTTYSMSPYIHNAAFRAAEEDSVFVPFQVKDLGGFFRRMVRLESREVELNLQGFSVTNPHKQQVIDYLDDLDPAAAAIGAVNTVKVDGGRLCGFNTDAEGFIAPLKMKFGDLAGCPAAIVGAGGAARACAHALVSAGADVTLVARDGAKARDAADSFEIGSLSLAEIGAGSMSDFDIIVNATPVGTRGEMEDRSVFTADQLNGVKLVYDLVYTPEETSLLHNARAAGAQTLGGLDMLIGQAIRQFEIWTGQTPHAEAMREAARRRIALQSGPEIIRIT